MLKRYILHYSISVRAQGHEETTRWGYDETTRFDRQAEGTSTVWINIPCLSHDLIDILSSFSDAKISQTPDQRREASREKVSRAFTYFSMSPLVMRLDSEWVKCAQCEFYLETALLIRLWLTSPSLLSPVSLSRARPVMQHNLAAHMKSTRLSNVKTPI